MKTKSTKLTTSQFANLHQINKRALHYYDSIGLFSPSGKGDHNYRYYDSSQSIDFEFLLILKELNMSIDEIHEYVTSHSPDAFVCISLKKISEIDEQIEKLQRAKQLPTQPVV